MRLSGTALGTTELLGCIGWPNTTTCPASSRLGRCSNERVWSSLSADLQEIIRRAAGASAFETYAEFTYENDINFPALGADGVEVRQFPADVVSAMARASDELIQEITSKGSFERRV
jgi:TRAP-type mannitol/chloroaromatic compound transport system substrate-binding protein